jgi:hypothetical protein
MPFDYRRRLSPLWRGCAEKPRPGKGMRRHRVGFAADFLFARPRHTG